MVLKKKNKSFKTLSNLPEDEGGTPPVRKKWGEPR